MRLTHFLVFFLISVNGFATGVIDSLKNCFEIEKNDSIKVQLLNDLSYEYLSIDVNQSLMYATKAIQLSDQIGSKFGLMRSWGQLGNAYKTIDNKAKAIEAYINAEKIASELKDNFRISACSHNIGVLYHAITQYGKSEVYLLKAIEYDKLLNEKTSLGESYNSLGAVYIDWGKLEKAEKALLQSVNYLNNQHHYKELAMPYSNLAIIEIARNNSKEAIKYYEKSFECYRSTKDNEKSAKVLRLIASEYYKLKDFGKTIYYYEQSIKYGEIDPNTEIRGKGIVQRIAEAYQSRGDLKKANALLTLVIENYHNNVQKQDSLNKKELDNIFAEMATKYETDKKEKQNKIQKLEIEKEKAANSKKNTIIYSFIVGLLLIVVLMIFIIRSYRITKSSNKKIQKQKEQIELQRDEISYKNQEITASIEYAKSLQDAILPDQEFIRNFLPEHFILWLPRDIVSGDFYWFYEKADKLFLAAADCTGHGVPGAFVSMTCHNILNQIVIDQNIEKPGDILSKVHIAVSKVFKREGSLSQANDGMDITLICIDKKSKNLYFSGAMNPLVQVHNGKLVQYKTDRYAIGGRTPLDFQFETWAIPLHKGDTYYLFSDGFKDQFGGTEGKKYMNANFLRYLEKIHKERPAKQRELLQNELTNWVGLNERTDDVLVVGFRIS